MNPLRHYIDILYEAEYDTRIAKLTQLYPNHKTDFDWAKTNLVRKDRIYWYLKQVEDLIKNNKPQDIKPLQDNLYHYIGQTDIQGIQNYPFNINQTTQDLFNQLQQIEQKYHSNTRPAALTTPNDIDLIKYPDGTRWVQLDRAYCEKEGRSGKHCGNIMGQHKTDQRILSYRDNRDRVILTFILEPNGTLGEMKGILNSKPDKKYHKQILNLLMLPDIKGISGGGALADSNFSIFDLDENYLKYVQDNKPSLIVDQLKVTPIDILDAPDFIKKNINYTDVVKQKLPSIGNLIDNPSLDNWEDAISKNDSLIIYAPDELNNYEERLLNYLQVYKPTTSTPYRAQTLLKVRKKYRTNYDFLHKLLYKSPVYIFAIPETTNKYRELLLMSLNVDAYILKLFPANKIDHDMALTALNSKLVSYGRDKEFIYKLIPNNIKQNSYDITYIAVKNGIVDVKNIRKDFIDDKMWIAQIIGRNYEINSWPQKFHNYNSFLEILKNEPFVLHYLDKSEKNYESINKFLTPEAYLTAVKSDGSILEYVPYKFRNMKISLAAVKNNGNALQYVPTKYRNEKLCTIAVNNNRSALPHVPEKIKTYKFYQDIMKDKSDLYNNWIPNKFRNKIEQEIDAKEQDNDELKEFKNTLNKIINL